MQGLVGRSKMRWLVSGLAASAAAMVVLSCGSNAEPRMTQQPLPTEASQATQVTTQRVATATITAPTVVVSVEHLWPEGSAFVYTDNFDMFIVHDAKVIAGQSWYVLRMVRVSGEEELPPMGR